MLTRFSLTSPERYLNKFPYELCCGQRQSVWIAHTLGPYWKSLLAYESVSMLDISMSLAMLKLFRYLKKCRKLANFYITHYMMYAGLIPQRHQQ